MHAWPLPAWSNLNHRRSWSKFVLPVGNLPSMICSKQGVSCQCTSTSVVSTPSTCNRCCTLAVALQASPTCMSLIFMILKFERTHLKFTVHGRKQANKQASKHTHECAECSNTSVGHVQACPNHSGGPRCTTVLDCIDLSLTLRAHCTRGSSPLGNWRQPHSWWQASQAQKQCWLVG